MPGDGFPFAVLVRCQPNFIRFFNMFFQFFDNFSFFRRYHIIWFEVVFNINSFIAFFKIPDMSVTGFDGEVTSKNFFYRFGFCRGFNNQ